MNFLSALLILIHAVLAGAWSAVPAPAHGITVSPAMPAPAAVAPTPSHGRAPAGGAHASVPAQRSAAVPTVAGPTAPHYAPPAPHHAPSGPTAPAPAPTTWPDTEKMCQDPVDCPPGM